MGIFNGGGARHGRMLWAAALFLVPVVVTGLTPFAQKRSTKHVSSAPSGAVWSQEEWEKARSFTPLPSPPANPTNALAASEQAARLGHRLFFDTRLSPHGVACSSCHKPKLGFTDGLQVGNTLAPLTRNTMTLLNVGYYRWLTWDGGKDSLWSQAVVPIENPKEMGASRLYVIRTVMRHYGDELAELVDFPAGWEALWPTLPASGKPGEPEYDRLLQKRKEAVNRVFAAILKTIAAYERKLVSGAAPFDRFVAGNHKALSRSAQRGFQLFLRFQCDTCHSTPLFSDDEFHNIGLPSEPVADRGRAKGLPRLQKDPFRGTGPYADGMPIVRPEDYRVGKALVGAFRTPSLRDIQSTGPYGHNGSIATLDDWMKHYDEVTEKTPDAFVGSLDASLPAVDISQVEKRALVDFVRSLSSDYASEWTREPEEAARADNPSDSQSQPTRTFDLTIQNRQVKRASNTIRVQQGQPVTLRWTTDEATEIHLHGYDIEKNVGPETPMEITFTAYAAGRFPITAHGFGKEHEERTLVYLEVLPR